MRSRSPAPRRAAPCSSAAATFVVALLGMFIVPTSIMRSLALGAILVGIVSVAAALTLLPALLSVVGDRVNSLRVPILGRNLGRADAAEGRFWRRIVDGVLRRPALWLVVCRRPRCSRLASPIFGLHIGANGVSTLPSNLPSKQGHVLLQRAFPVQNPEPVRIVAVGGNAVGRTQRSRAAQPSAGRRGQLRRGRDPDVRGDHVGAAHVARSRRRRRRVGRQRGARPPHERHPVDRSAAAARRSTSAGSPRRTSTTSTR